MKPSSDRSARGFCTEGGSVGGWVAKEAGAERKGWVGVGVGGGAGAGGRALGEGTAVAWS